MIYMQLRDAHCYASLFFLHADRLKVFGTGGGRVGERKVNLLEESPGFVGQK